jgi:hypothetical protein
MNSARDEGEFGIDCGGGECALCVPCSDTLPYKSVFSVKVDVTTERWEVPVCDQMDTHSVVERVLALGETGEELTIDGNAVNFKSFSVEEDALTVSFHYDSALDDSWGWCPLVGRFFDGFYGIIWELDIDVDKATGQITARERCQDYGGMCMARPDWGYENARAKGRGYNVCE